MSNQDKNEMKNNIELELEPKQKNIKIEIKENHPQTTLLLDPNSQELEPKKNYNFIIYFMICIIFYYCFFGNMNISKKNMILKQKNQFKKIMDII